MYCCECALLLTPSSSPPALLTASSSSHLPICSPASHEALCVLHNYTERSSYSSPERCFTYRGSNSLMPTKILLQWLKSEYPVVFPSLSSSKRRPACPQIISKQKLLNLWNKNSYYLHLGPRLWSVTLYYVSAEHWKKGSEAHNATQDKAQQGNQKLKHFWKHRKCLFYLLFLSELKKQVQIHNVAELCEEKC